MEDKLEFLDAPKYDQAPRPSGIQSRLAAPPVSIFSMLRRFPQLYSDTYRPGHGKLARSRSCASSYLQCNVVWLNLESAFHRKDGVVVTENRSIGGDQVAINLAT